jgi:hypothetical protein
VKSDNSKTKASTFELSMTSISPVWLSWKRTPKRYTFQTLKISQLYLTSSAKT